jgi:YbbR domain-containing protein
MKDFLFRNLSLKILSFFFAVSLWLFVNLKATAENTLQVPLRWESLPNFLEITNEVNDSIRVRVAGPRRILSNLEPKKLTVTLDLSDAKVGLSNYQINEKMIPMPPGLTATVLPPDTIQFKFDLIVTKGVEVRPRLTGSPKEGHVVESVEVTPSRVEIVGAQSEVQGMSQVETEPIDLTNRQEGFETQVKISLKRAHAWPSTGQEQVGVRVAIAEKILERLMKGISLKVENARGPIRLDPPRVDIMLEGPASRVDSVQPDQVEASVVIPDQGPCPASLPVTIRVAVEGVGAKSSPEAVGVKTLPQRDSP